jgi:hemerythrin
MSRVHWSKDLEVGVEVMDTQHRKLVEYVNALDDSLAAGSVKAATDVVLKFIGYAELHFGAEEALMSKYAYVFETEHRRMHSGFLKTSMEGFKKLRKGDTAAGWHLLAYFKDWLVKHIKVEDPKVALVVKAHGVPASDAPAPPAAAEPVAPAEAAQPAEPVVAPAEPAKPPAGA